MSHFCFKLKNHASSTLNVLENLRSMENFVDVTLACEGQLIKAHKVILSAGSKFFHNLFTTNPCKHPIIVMHNVKYSILKDIIDFMYKGEIYVTYDQLEDVLKTTKTLDVKGLVEIIQDVGFQETHNPFTALSSTTGSMASRQKRICVQNKVSDSASVDNEIVSNVKEVPHLVSGEPTVSQTSASANISNSNTLLPSGVIILPRTTKRLVNSPLKSVSVPLSEISIPELEVDPVPDHDYNGRSFRIVQMNSASEQSEISKPSAKSTEPLIHNITSSDLVPVPIIPSNPLTSVVILDQNASDSHFPTCSSPSAKTLHRLMRARISGENEKIKRIRRRCVGCYRRLRVDQSSAEAQRLARRVTTYCDDCPKKPFYCLNCFFDNH
ncbi:transcription factor GAGA-like [Stegodyphus dumicola]|uniref:transcription factor GAGA-like n=1 Tax=Stegodyphus dumicola TaxID=202533 RepID=UPI0015B12E8F|nr:transcription factor GAGA-like [Stegodyphus dumicola]XP_035204492.1 transcription factor GAGA-like [Stegodyphus dumicola]